MKYIKKLTPKSKKTLAIMVTSVLVIALCLGSVFAWRDFSQSFNNVQRGGSAGDILLHDDFQPWKHKDVYVENLGEQAIIARVKLNEFLQIGNEIIVGTHVDDKETYITHIFDNDNEASEGATCTLETHQYFEFELSGESKIYLHGTSELGWQDYSGKTPEVRDENGIVTVEGDMGENGLHFARTLPAAPVMTMAQWIASDGTAACWVLDTDGWAYWSQAIDPGYATNLLISNVNQIKTPNDNWNYNVDVVMHATNLAEAHEMYDRGTSDDATEDAIDYIINKIVGQRTQRRAEDLQSLSVGDYYVDNNGIEWVVLNETAEGDLLITTTHIYNPGLPYLDEYELYENSPLQSEMQSWYRNTAGSDIQAVARDYAYSQGTKGEVGAGIEYDFTGTYEAYAETTNKWEALTKPVGMVGGGRVFPASVSEANQYFATNGSRTESDPEIPFLGWWLRSPGGGNPITRAYVDEEGVIHTD